jgi:hypothetical protein
VHSRLKYVDMAGYSPQDSACYCSVEIASSIVGCSREMVTVLKRGDGSLMRSGVLSWSKAGEGRAGLDGRIEIRSSVELSINVLLF